jgi:hypothetical protein
MSWRCSTRISGAFLASLLALAASPASAHHSAAVFDMSKQISVQGTVEKWLWANPHSWLYLRVVKSDGSQEVWGFEAGSTGMLARSGWNAADMKPGDKVTVSASPQRDGQHIALLNQVRLPSGRVLNAGFGARPPGAPGPTGAPGASPPGAPGAPQKAPAGQQGVSASPPGASAGQQGVSASRPGPSANGATPAPLPR